MRLSSYLANQHGYSRRFIKTLIADGKVLRDGFVIRSDINTEDGVKYAILLDKSEFAYDLNDYLIKTEKEAVFLYKPPLMHTERHTPLDPLCLDDILDKHFPEYRLLSRLDYGVGGVVAALREDVAAENERKNYLAWLAGDFNREGVSFWAVDARKRRKVKVLEQTNGGRMEFSVIKKTDGFTLVHVELTSAARHQVRAVCAAMGFPIADDYIYGAEGDARAIGLHCCKVFVCGKSAESPNARGFYEKKYGNMRK